MADSTPPGSTPADSTPAGSTPAVSTPTDFEPTESKPTGSKPHRARRIIAWVLIVLTALLVPLATTSVWATRTVLNTDRFMNVASSVTSNPTVISSLSTYVTDQAANAIVDTGVLDNLPSILKPVVPIIGGALRDRVSQRVDDFLSSDQGQALLTSVVRTAHKAALRLLEGDGLFSSGGLSVEQGKVTLNLVPIVREVLLRLQSDGVVPASVKIPPPDAPVGAYAQSIGKQLPPDFGQIVVYDTHNASQNGTLDQAQRILVLAKRGVVADTILALLFALAAVLVAPEHRRAVFRVGVGIALVSVLLIIVARRVAANVPNVVSAPGGKAAASALADAMRASLVRALIIVAGVALVTAIVTLKAEVILGWAAKYPKITRSIAVAVGVVILLVLGLGWWSLLFAVLVVALGFAAVWYGTSLEAKTPSTAPGTT